MRRPPSHSLDSPTVKTGDRRPGFTLIELLTVIAIVGILMGIIIPTLGSVQRSARKAKSSSNLRNIGAAMGSYANDHDGLLPAPTFGASSAPTNAVGSANPRGGTWLEELVYPYLEGQIQPSEDGSKVIVTKWPDVMTDPEYFMDNNDVISEPDKRGYGMNIYPFLADRSGNEKRRTQSFPIQRQKEGLLPNPSNNVIAATSDGTTIEPGPDGLFPRTGNDEYNVGNPVRFGGIGLYLFLDWNVQALSPQDAAKVLSDSSEGP